MAWFKPWTWGKERDWKNLGRTFTRAEVFQIIRARVGPHVRIKLRDGKYPFRAISHDDFEQLMFECREIDPDYIQDSFDCDDSGDTFMGDMKRGWAKRARGKESLLLGWTHVEKKHAHGATHWMNWMINDHGVFTLVEPQRNDLVYPEIHDFFEVTQ